jgi:hypothetical protein
MGTETYRLNRAILSIHSDIHGHRFTVMIPPGAVITAADHLLDDNRFITVHWEHQTVMLFAVDLRERATAILAASNSR